MAAAGLVAPTRAQQGELYGLAYDLHQASIDKNRAVRQMRAPPPTAATARGGPSAARMPELHAAALAEAVEAETAVLGRVSEFIDANPTLRLDNSVNPDDELEDTQLAVELAISTNPASVPIYQTMVARQPDILTTEFEDTTLEQHITRELARVGGTSSPATGEARKVLQDKLNPGRAQEVKMNRLFGAPEKDRKASPLPRNVQYLVREQLTGKSFDELRTGVTKKGGRRHKKTRRTRKPKRLTRKRA
jgi:hypothetical protein